MAGPAEVPDPRRGPPIRRRVLAGLFVLLAVPIVLGDRGQLGAVDGNRWLFAGVLLVVLIGVLVILLVRPIVAIVVAGVVCVVDVWFVIAFYAVCYLAARRTEQERAMLIALAATITACSAAVLLGGSDARVSFGIVALLLGGVLAWLVGRYRAQREALTEAGWELAGRLDAELSVATREVRDRERARIAQEMHDVLGHELALIALRAGALEVSPGADPHVQDAAREVREGTARATECLQNAIGMLRPASGPSAPDDNLTALVERARASGMRLTLDVSGDPPDHALVRGSVHQIVREALTNAAKYAPGAVVEVRVDNGPHRTDVVVVNGPPPAGPLPGASGSHRGLAGLSERVELVGGTFEAGPDGRGFRVAAGLPLATAVGPPSEDTSAVERYLPQGPTQQRRRVQRDLRRTLLTAVVVPVALVLLFTSGMIVYFSGVTEDSVLSAGTFDDLRVGTARSEFAATLPVAQVDPPAGAPDGPGCEFYRTRNGDLLADSFPVYRLCFSDGVLSTKDLVR